MIDSRVAADSDLDALLSSNVIRVELVDHHEDVDGSIEGIDGESVVREETRNGITTGEPRNEAQLTDEIIGLAREKGWKINAISPETPSLAGIQT